MAGYSGVSQCGDVVGFGTGCSLTLPGCDVNVLRWKAYSALCRSMNASQI